MAGHSEDPLAKSALEQAELVRSGELSASELVDASLAAIEERNDRIGAFVRTSAERARAEAAAIEAGDSRPFAGVPIAIKDLTATEGIQTSFGTRISGDFTPPVDASVVRRLRAAGAIVVGKTNTPELGILPVTEPERFAPSRNPWDETRTPGGSSGGSSAAVAAGMVSIAHGNDGGGSIRIPASCCGLVGLKPSRGRISEAPTPNEPSGIVTQGVLTHTVADSAAALDAMAGYEPGDPYWAPEPSTSFADAARREPGKLRVAFTTKPANDVAVDEECASAARDAAATLESLGHDVEEAAPDSDPAFVQSFIRIWISEIGSSVKGLELLLGEQADRGQLEPLTRQMLELAEQTNVTDYWLALAQLRMAMRQLLTFWQSYDVLLTPTLATPPTPLGALQPRDGEEPLAMLNHAGDFVPFTPVWNMTGQPAISLPLHQSADGLPVGVQFVGPPAGEELLLSLAGQLEQAVPWAERRAATITA